MKALKIIINDLRSNGESATMAAQGGVIDADSDDGVCLLTHPGFLRISLSPSLQDDDWEDEDSVNPLNKDEIAFLSGASYYNALK